MARFVITGTDTDAGKTVFAAGLAGHLGARYWKPVQAGLDGETDSQLVARLSGGRATVLPEAYRLTTPCSPHEAARIDGVAIDLARLALAGRRWPAGGRRRRRSAGAGNGRSALRRSFRALGPSRGGGGAHCAGHDQPLAADARSPARARHRGAGSRLLRRCQRAQRGSNRRALAQCAISAACRGSIRWMPTSLAAAFAAHIDPGAFA